jgi:hypothetical protein
MIAFGLMRGYFARRTVSRTPTLIASTTSITRNAAA